ncbi:MAG: stage IV sporulation protein A [Butyricicoccaceae bacterium]
MTLEEPEIVRQGGRYGVRLRASAPSIHLLSANISAEVNPIVGSEKQSEELVHYLLSEFRERAGEDLGDEHLRQSRSASWCVRSCAHKLQPYAG